MRKQSIDRALLVVLLAGCTSPLDAIRLDWTAHPPAALAAPAPGEQPADDPASELRDLATALVAATDARPPSESNNSAILRLATRLAMFERRFGVRPSDTVGWEELNSRAAKLLDSYAAWNRLEGRDRDFWLPGYFGPGSSSALCSLYLLAGRPGDARRMLCPPEPIPVCNYSPWAPIGSLAALAHDRACLYQLEGDKRGALRAALEGCFTNNGSGWELDELFVADVGLLLSDCGHRDEAVLLLRHVAAYAEESVAGRLARDELTRLGVEPGNRVGVDVLELFRWECWSGAQVALVLWDPAHRGSVRLFAIRESLDPGDADSAVVHTVADSLLPARDSIDAMLQDPEPIRRWWGLLLLAGVDAAAAERRLPDLLSWTCALPPGGAVGVPIDRVATAVCGNGPILEKKAAPPIVCSAWIDWLAANPAR